MPEWMQIRAGRPQPSPDVEAYFGGRQGALPTRSVFSFMHTRHNVGTKEQAERSNAQASATNIYRIYEWKEDVKKQRYDSVPIAQKIGALRY